MVASRYRGNLKFPLPSPTERTGWSVYGGAKAELDMALIGRRLLHLARRSVPIESGAAGRARRPDGWNPQASPRSAGAGLG